MLSFYGYHNTQKKSHTTANVTLITIFVLSMPDGADAYSFLPLCGKKHRV